MRTATVLHIEPLAPQIRLLRLGGPELIGFTADPGQKVKLRLSCGAKASYTPARVNPDAGWLDVVFHLHGNDGPLASWAAEARSGAQVSVLGPARSMAGPTGDEAWAIFLGDETTLGLAVALIDALPPEASILGALELAPGDVVAADRLRLPLPTIAREGGYGDVLRAWLADTEIPSGPGVVWLSGHAGTVVSLRQALLGRGVPRSLIKVKAYWSDHGHTHRKMLERTHLGA